MSDLSPLARAFDVQAGACAALGSPFSGALLSLAKADIEAGGAMADLLSPWKAATARSLMEDAVPLRWLGCAHDLVLSGEAPALAAAFPSPGRAGDAEGAWSAAKAVMAAAPERFATFMRHEPQTNEVRRSACLLPGILTLARETGLPLRVFEIGASAGLNQLWDSYRYDFGAAGVWGPDVAAVRIDAEWRGAAAALDTTVSVVSRRACDRKPVDIRDPVARRRLKAYVWADQFDRLARLESAIAAALAGDVRVDAEDAVSWTAANAVPLEGATTMLVHSVFWQYMPAESQAALTRVIAGLGERAEPTAPFAWLRMEPSPRSLASMELRLTLWPGGEDRLLAHVHPHGAWVDWGGA
jgi:hypothetical protein